MDDLAAIRACFTHWVPVKGRSVLQLQFEIPIEEQANVLTYLGAPGNPGESKWVAIALLKSPAGETIGKETASQAPAGVAKTEGERAVQRAAIMVKKYRFSDWINEDNDVHPINPNLYLYGYCGISSKADLATNPDARQKFYDLESKFRAWEQEHPF